ncbi:MAG: hypothetical protein K0Q79_536 [Flavipsychrobacter sp.]|jgi:uncharacterized protein YdeI (YjbR/CyaY-like superfamily)|nr:hypothetical protein [Flavipsychrobacter sp.]
MNPKVDFFFNKDTKWQKEYEQLRKLILDCLPAGQAGGLMEELKWGCPCYTSGKKNVVLIHGFKEYCALLFFKGALLSDPDGILIQQTENVQVPRQLRFTNVKEIVKLKQTIKAYVYEAIEVEKAGLKVPLKKTEEYNIPEEFQLKLDKSAKLRTAFKALTPGRQRAYLFHFSQAKQSKTREARVEQYIPQILAGKGLDD